MGILHFLKQFFFITKSRRRLLGWRQNYVCPERSFEKNLNFFVSKKWTVIMGSWFCHCLNDHNCYCTYLWCNLTSYFEWAVLINSFFFSKIRKILLGRKKNKLWVRNVCTYVCILLRTLKPIFLNIYRKWYVHLGRLLITALFNVTKPLL